MKQSLHLVTLFAFLSSNARATGVDVDDSSTWIRQTPENVRYVDFNDFLPGNDAHLQSLMPSTGPAAGGFTFGEPVTYPSTAAHGVRQNRSDSDMNITWPTQAYYTSVLGADGFQQMQSWDMKPTVIYALPNPSGGWHAGWKLYQDKAEGATCVDDTARAALYYIDRYIFDPTDTAAYNNAIPILNWLGYMVSADGRTYNCAWLDSPAFFTYPDASGQSMNKHYYSRIEYYARTQYPALSTAAQWVSNPTIDPSHILTSSSGTFYSAPPFQDHAKYSIFMNDMASPTAANVSTQYYGPTGFFLLPGASGTYPALQSNIVSTTVHYSSSFSNFGFHTARNLWAFARAMKMLARHEQEVGTANLTLKDITLKKFVENHFNRLANFVLSQDTLMMDSKVKSVLAAAFIDYMEAVAVGFTRPASNPQYYVLTSPSFGTVNVDRPITVSQAYAKLDILLAQIMAEQHQTSDWRNGGFFYYWTEGKWSSWGEAQIYALSRGYQFKVGFLGQTGDQPNLPLLQTATLAADAFYGQHVYYYADNAQGNTFHWVHRTTSIQAGWAAQFFTTESQSPYEQTPIIEGLYELANAWTLCPTEVVSESERTARKTAYLTDMMRVGSWFIGNNSARSPMYDPQTGAFFDIINPPDSDSASVPGIIGRASGGESNAEGLRSFLYIRKALQDNSTLTSTVQIGF